MSQEEQKVIDFVTHLPTNPNPYEAAAAMLQGLIKSPQSPQWSRVLKIITLIIFGVMFAQACFLQYQRLKLNTSYSLTFNRLGLLVINVSDTSALAYCIYAPLSIILLSYQIAIDYGHLDETIVVILFGLKFIPIFAASWAFLWVCCCQCALLLWESNFATHFNPALLQPTIKWGLNVFFLSAMFAPIPAVIWSYILAFKDSRRIYALVAQIQASLFSAARTYDPGNFNRIGLLKLLLPSRQLISYENKLEHHIMFGIRVYGLALLLLVVIYVPCLVISLRGLYRRSVSQKALDAAVGGRSSKPSHLSRKIHQERRRLVYHSLVVYCSTAVHLPVIIWQLFHSHRGFTRDSNWKEITYHGLAVPFSITGNIILFILNVHSRNLRREMRDFTPGLHGGVCSGLKPQMCGLKGPGSGGRVIDVELGELYGKNRLYSWVFAVEPPEPRHAKNCRNISTMGSYIEPSLLEATRGTSINGEIGHQEDLFKNQIIGVQINQLTVSHTS